MPVERIIFHLSFDNFICHLGKTSVQIVKLVRSARTGNPPFLTGWTSQMPKKNLKCQMENDSFLAQRLLAARILFSRSLTLDQSAC